MGASLLGSLASISQNIVTIERDRPVSGKRRRVAPSKRQKRTSRYMPHQGTKERERAARSYMQPFHGRMSDYSPNLRSASVVHQMSKRDYYGQPF
jgi:hypothetical protein